jgi:hypothetical protein
VAEPGSQFAAWSDACSGVAIGATCQVLMSQPRTAMARFVPLRRLVISSGGSDGRGRVTGPGGVDCQVNGASTSGTCTADVVDGTSVLLTATPDASVVGTVVGPWSGSCAGTTAAACTVVVAAANQEAGVQFLAPKSLRVSVSGAGGGTVVSAPGTLACTRSGGGTSGQCDIALAHGTIATLTATPTAISSFAGWSGACAGTATPTCVTTLTAARLVEARFDPRLVSLGLVLSGDAAGSLSVNGTVACSLAQGQRLVSCQTLLPAGSTAIITGTGGARSQLVNVTGACRSLPCTLMMTEPVSVEAVAVSVDVPITLALSGGGGGMLRVNNGAACEKTVGSSPVQCTVLVERGTTVTVTAGAGNASTFSAFTDACSGLACRFTAEGPVTVGGTFSRLVRIVVAPMIGATAAGRVSGGTIDCRVVALTKSGVCEGDVVEGSTVTVRADADANSALLAWGDVCAGASTTTCTFTASVTASGAEQQVSAQIVGALTASITVSGGGPGLITLDLPGVPSQDVCSYSGGAPRVCLFTVPFGRTGMLRGLPEAGIDFSGFTGVCDQPGTAPFAECTFRAIGFSRSMSATFTRR